MSCLCSQWVPNTDSPSKQGDAVRIENRNQFAPLGPNPKEFVQAQRQVCVCCSMFLSVPMVRLLAVMSFRPYLSGHAGHAASHVVDL